MRHYPDVKAFLDYVDGIISNDEFVQQLIKRYALTQDDAAALVDNNW